MSSGPDIEVFVLATPGRYEAHQRCFRSIEASDIGRNYRPCFNPRGMQRRQHWLRTHQMAANAKSDFVLVLEDDCLVNEHILHNCRTWKWKHDPMYAAGWLYSPGGLFGGRDVWYTKDREWYGTVGVLYKRQVLPTLIERTMNYLEKYNSNAWDCGISRAILTGGYRLRVHGPPIVEHMVNVPSALNHQQNYWFGSTRGHFKDRWKRSALHEHAVRG